MQNVGLYIVGLVMVENLVVNCTVQIWMIITIAKELCVCLGLLDGLSGSRISEIVVGEFLWIFYIKVGFAKEIIL